MCGSEAGAAPLDLGVESQKLLGGGVAQLRPEKEQGSPDKGSKAGERVSGRRGVLLGSED